MTHFLVMTLFALLVAIAFGIVGRETLQERVRYGGKYSSNLSEWGSPSPGFSTSSHCERSDHNSSFY